MKSVNSLGAIDVGSSKVAFVFGEIVGSNFSIIGSAVSRSCGVKKGAIVDVKAAIASVNECIRVAKGQYGNLPSKILLSQSGAGLRSVYSKININTKNSDGVVSSSDVDRAKKEAVGKIPAVGTLFLHHFLQGFSVDDELCENPIGIKAHNFSAEYCSISCDERSIKDNLFIVNQLGLKVDALIFSGVASSFSVATQLERDHGALIIDVGAETTTYCVYKNKKLVTAGLIPVGGVNFTNDLCSGLLLHFDDGESLKMRLGIPSGCENSEAVWVKGDHSIGDKSVCLKNIYKILHARAEELFECISSSIKQHIGGHVPFLRVILTGGGSQLNGIADVASRVFEADCEVRSPVISVSEKLKNPALSSCIGLLCYVSNIQKEKPVSMKKTGILGRLSEWFNI